MSEHVSGTTRLLCVIGDPIQHTMSPRMHNAALRAACLDGEYVYVAFHVLPSRLGEAIAGFKALGIHGINVTIPHKVAVMQHLDAVDPLAASIGAVNTIRHVDGRLEGRNTDAGGAVAALRGAGVGITGARCTLLGSGGAARAIGFALVDAGASVTMVSKEVDVARRVCHDINAFFPNRPPVTCVDWDDGGLDASVPGRDILVNATPVGMHPCHDASPVPPSLLRDVGAVFDAVYNPHETRLLAMARDAGAVVVHGIDMLVAQGALAFEWWTGVAPPAGVMAAAAREVLGTRDS